MDDLIGKWMRAWLQSMCWPSLCSLNTNPQDIGINVSYSDEGPNPLLTLLNHWFFSPLSAHTHIYKTFTPLQKCSLFWVLLHTLMWRGQAEAPSSSPGRGEEQNIQCVRNIWESALSRAYLAGGWYWHRQPSYRGPFISVWTCGLGPNPGRSRRAHRQQRGRGVVAPRRNPALLLYSGAPPSIPASLPVSLSMCKLPSPPPNMLSNPELVSASNTSDGYIRVQLIWGIKSPEADVNPNILLLSESQFILQLQTPVIPKQTEFF